jgi:hypothetical protein
MAAVCRRYLPEICWYIVCVDIMLARTYTVRRNCISNVQGIRSHQRFCATDRFTLNRSGSLLQDIYCVYIMYISCVYRVYIVYISCIYHVYIVYILCIYCVYIYIYMQSKHGNMSDNSNVQYTTTCFGFVNGSSSGCP